jgi:hypothetical protein
LQDRRPHKRIAPSTFARSGLRDWDSRIFFEPQRASLAKPTVAIRHGKGMDF